MQLPGRVQKARTEADGRRHLERVAHFEAEIVQREAMFVVHFEIGREREVVAGLDLREEGRERGGEIGAEVEAARAGQRDHVRDRRRERDGRLLEAAGLLEVGQEAFGVVF